MYVASGVVEHALQVSEGHPLPQLLFGAVQPRAVALQRCALLGALHSLAALGNALCGEAAQLLRFRAREPTARPSRLRAHELSARARADCAREGGGPR